ncbi:MAG TPA: ParB/RepB/Spo0J family partition protein [Thermoanaerobaculia bacterium]|nr:ParB/RepB/Spo0J family partition protein [Thermoanaerobaculia bacterium]
MRKGLGRGLDAILPKADPTAATGGGVQTVPVASLVPNQVQPRARFDEEGLDELARSIRVQGVIQPLIVAPRPDGTFTIVAGERRWRAAQRCGLAEVPVVVRDVEGDQQLLELALVENLQRADLNAIEEAEAYRSLQDRFQLTQEQIAERVGRARTSVTNSLRLLRLPVEVQDLLRSGALTPGQARPLLGVDTPRRQVELAQQAVRDGLSARRMEALAAAPSARSRSSERARDDVHTAAAAEALTRALQTRVEIRRSGQGGTVRVHFHSEEELIRIHDLLVRRS